jgi:hypothetical protein
VADRLVSAGQYADESLNSMRGRTREFDRFRRTPRRKNRTAEGMANGIAGSPNQ